MLPVLILSAQGPGTSTKIAIFGWGEVVDRHGWRVRIRRWCGSSPRVALLSYLAAVSTLMPSQWLRSSQAITLLLDMTLPISFFPPEAAGTSKGRLGLPVSHLWRGRAA